MAKRKYILMFDGDRLAASLDGKENDKTIPKYVEIAKSTGWTVKEVSKAEFDEEIRKEEERELREVFG